jgi:hypothetical protein
MNYDRKVFLSRGDQNVPLQPPFSTKPLLTLSHPKSPLPEQVLLIHLISYPLNIFFYISVDRLRPLFDLVERLCMFDLIGANQHLKTDCLY